VGIAEFGEVITVIWGLYTRTSEGGREKKHTRVLKEGPAFEIRNFIEGSKKISQRRGGVDFGQGMLQKDLRSA